ncbi:MAG: hypothetical protein RLZZ577_1450 [Bacteroidota bacterium]
MDLKNAQLDVDTWIKEHGVRYFNELTNMAHALSHAVMANSLRKNPIKIKI